MHGLRFILQGLARPEDVSVSITEEEALNVVRGAQQQQRAGVRVTSHVDDEARGGWGDSAAGTAAAGSSNSATESWTEVAKVTRLPPDGSRWVPCSPFFLGS